jgi:hypothetical protein
MNTSSLVLISLVIGCGSDKAVSVHNSAPAATITSPTEGMTYYAGDLIIFKGVVSDAQTSNDGLVVTWDTDKEGLLSDEALADIDGITQFSVGDLTPGETHAVTLRVVDEGGKSASDTVVIEVRDADVVVEDSPRVTVLAPHPSGSDSPWEADIPFQFEVAIQDDVDPPTLITITVSLIDEDGEVLEDLCSTLGTAGGGDDGSGYGICEAALSAGNHHIGFSAVDTEGYIGTATSELKVISGDQVDNDGDGYTGLEGDCDDTDEDVHPGAFELVNGVDDDCDGIIDDGTSAYDDDGDGYSEDAGDCNDADASIYPYATEVCDGVDNDCNGLTDGSDATDGTTYYRDLDADGYGDWGSSITSCDPVPGYTTDATDCDDTAIDAHPGATEVCDGIDNNCDGFTDEEGADGCSVWYEDSDDDGYGSTSSICACTPTGDYTSTLSSDCYDASASVNPTHTSFHTSNRGDGSYDYNCDDTEEKETTATSDSCAWFDDFGCSSPDGWASSPPACGTTGNWRTECHYVWFSGCEFETETAVTQACR